MNKILDIFDIKNNIKENKYHRFFNIISYNRMNQTEIGKLIIIFITYKDKILINI